MKGLVIVVANLKPKKLAGKVNFLKCRFYEQWNGFMCLQWRSYWSIAAQTARR